MSRRAGVRGDLEKIAVARGVSAGDEWVTVPAERIREALEAARGEGYDFFSFITCVDHLARDDGRPPFTGPQGEGPPPRFEVVYELRDMVKVRLIRIRAFLGAENPTIASAHDLFGPANWDEREVWDLFRIRFEGARRDHGPARARRTGQRADPHHQLRAPPPLDPRGAAADRRPRR